MVVLWALGLTLMGFLYGAILPGKQSTAELLGRGLAVGMALALAGVFVAALFGLPAVLAAMLGGLGILAASGILSALFAAGVFLGDLATGARSLRSPATAEVEPKAAEPGRPLLDGAEA